MVSVCSYCVALIRYHAILLKWSVFIHTNGTYYKNIEVGTTRGLSESEFLGEKISGMPAI